MLDARSWHLHWSLSEPLNVAYFLSILYRQKRKVGIVREDALVITKILYSRGTNDSTAIHQAENTMSTARAIQENPR
jgi:hypothetical protein